MDGSTVSALCRFIGRRNGVCPVWPVRKPVRLRSLSGKYPGRRNVSDAEGVWRRVRINVWGLGTDLTGISDRALDGFRNGPVPELLFYE